ncbi:MAG: methionine--tRNA ligase [Candidatus Omnitrophica bacterium]|nr:methionine--tRNA ligase [Candidatus Omnitrophota bacterium]
MPKKFYLTTPLYYVNDVPHIGHSYTNILADCVARFKRLEGRDVFFLTGTDEHGEKIARAAEAAGETPQAFVDRISPRFRELWAALGVSHDDFIRTTEDRHVRTVAWVLGRLKESGDIYAGEYGGFYCTPCETFWTEAELKAQPGAGSRLLCPSCARPVEPLREKNYFFRMSRYQAELVRHIEMNPGFIRPEARRNEILSFLKGPLNDLCVARPKSRLSWGIPIPFDPSYVTYVWVDALINYVSACGLGLDEGRFGKWWPADVHLIGKDILRHHTVIWISLLMALKLPLPATVLAHGWWTVRGEKMSKSKGNVVDPHRAIEAWGRDAYRYFLLREVPLGQDGDYSETALSQRYRNDLANDFGNLVNRTLSMVHRYFGGHIPDPNRAGGESPLKGQALELGPRVRECMDQYLFKESLEEIWKVVERANRYVEETRPWDLAREKREAELGLVLYGLCEVVRILGVLTEPFLPDTARAIDVMLGADLKVGGRWESACRWGSGRPGQRLGSLAILFPRRETDG